MSENQKVIEIEVLRYHPEKDKEPHKQVFEVPFTDDMSVLQGVQYIKDYLDGSLSFRWSCRMAICGSCGMMINGEPSLSCQTFLRDFYPARVRVEALAHFPIERDLVISMDGFIEKLGRTRLPQSRRVRLRAALLAPEPTAVKVWHSHAHFRPGRRAHRTTRHNFRRRW